MSFFFLLMMLLPLLHNGWFLPTCSAKKPPFDITTDASSLIAFRDHLLTTSHVNNILRNNWTSDATSSNISTNTLPEVCQWIGVTCGARHQRVVALDLGDMGLSGTIPPQIGNLSFLVYLDISNNKFHGQIPEGMARLRRLRYIKAGFNSFSGRIPSWFGFLPQLKHLQLQNNSFTAPIPAYLSNCSKLEVVNASNNHLSGMIPQEMGNLHSLKSFQMFGNQLSGEIPRSIFNISSLETLRLAQNRISGSLPEDVCTSFSKLWYLTLSWNELEGRILHGLQFCSQLEVLSLSYNKFHGHVPSVLGNLTMLNNLFLGDNNLEGHIPCELANLVHLKKLGLQNAGLGGSIPPSIFKNVTSLETLNLKRNSLSGSIPNEIGNCTSIHEMWIEDNFLIGELPSAIGNSLCKLEILAVSMNNIGGHVPDTLFNVTSLRVLALTDNHITGDLPSTIGFGLPNLEELYLAKNQFSGTIPESISNASTLTILDLSNNSLTGSPPNTVGNIRLLKWLGIANNNLKVLNAATFFASLSSCRYLQKLDMRFSQVNGPLPSSFGNLTSSLELFVVSSCGIIGKIPQGIGNMSILQNLDLSSNQFVGSLPRTLRGLSNLERFVAYNNNLSGSIPGDLLCLLPRLGQLLLQRNKFTGSLPDCLGNTTTLRYLYLYDNKVSSKLPASLGMLKDILEFDLSSNYFTGYFPLDIGNLRAAIFIDLAMNQLSGPLPTAIGSLQTLANLHLEHNKFEGPIPGSFHNLLSIVELDLSYNNLSGEIPKSLESLSHLQILYLSFNQLIGEVPNRGPFENFTYLSFESNRALCGSPRFHVSQCQSDGPSKRLTKRRKVLLFAYVLTGMTLLTLAFLAILYVMLKCRKHRIPLVEDLQPAVTHERISYYELLQATNLFNDSNLLGRGSFGSVYKGVFENGKTWAVKVFHLQVERSIRSFNTECDMLRNIRHRNLTKVISSCTNLDFIALVLEYMPNGSLDRWLYSHNYILDFKKRLDIMIDVASALDYLHHGYFVPVVHCDLKPSNVLLDEDMVAHVSDFGISKFLEEEGSIAQTNTLATTGYTAPEYGQEGLVSTKCDVYSFGIMLMEVFTRKRPTEEMFNEDLFLKVWVMQSLPDRVMEVIDGNLVREKVHQVNAMMQCVSALLELACNCSADSPDDRMNMRDVLASLKKINLRFLSNATSS